MFQGFQIVKLPSLFPCLIDVLMKIKKTESLGSQCARPVISRHFLAHPKQVWAAFSERPQHTNLHLTSQTSTVHVAWNSTAASQQRLSPVHLALQKCNTSDLKRKPPCCMMQSCFCLTLTGRCLWIKACSLLNPPKRISIKLFFEETLPLSAVGCVLKMLRCAR